MKPTAIDENQKLKFDQDLFGAWDMNPTLVSVVPLAIFKVSELFFRTPGNRLDGINCQRQDDSQQGGGTCASSET